MIKITGLHDWMANLPEELRTAISAQSKPRQLAAGQKLYSSGESAGELYKIVSGKLKILNYTADGRESVIAELYSGDCAGVMGVIDGLPRGNTAIAEVETVVSVLAGADFLRFFNTRVEVAQQLCLMLCSRFRLSVSRIEEASSLTLSQRLVRHLVRQAYARGRPTDDGSIVITDISHESLSNILGATRQSVSRELNQLKKSGQLELSYRKIRIFDLEKLAENVDQLVGIESITPDYDMRILGEGLM
jgi:CRP/FNR family cyclic AMP-dependent transcriptional regulator